MLKRIVSDIILFFAIFFLPWWGTIILAFVLMIYFKNFWEGVTAIFFIDLLYSVPTERLTGHFGIFTASSLILFFIINNIKSRIRI